jgi:hypothetical protein
MVKLKENTLRESHFHLDAFPEESYRGYTRGQTWNGWACPYFEFEEAQRVVQSQVRRSNDLEDDREYKAEYRQGEDAFCFWDPYYEEWITYESIEIDGKKFYPVGAFEWTWVEEER